MFTDIAGYTALMQQSEESANSVRTKHRAVFEKFHNNFNGEIIQYFGDGTLSIFKSAVEATSCAIELQKELQQGEPLVPLRIGIHLGDIVYSNQEVYGDGVNLASRIESLGQPGSVLLSAKINDELKNQPELKTKSLGRFDLKNVLEPVEIFCVINEDLIIPEPADLNIKPVESVKSIAVLPLVNRSSNPENEYFSDGMTDEIINALTKVKGLKVTSRTSSFYFKDKNLATPQIGKELNVSTILEGSVRLAANKIRISVQLIDVAEDYQFWSETFDRYIDDIFLVQDEVSLLIADKLREHLGHLEIQDHLVEAPEVPVDVYKQYLKSRYHMLKMSKPEIEKGLSILSEIISTNPNYPYAQLGMHMGYTLLGSLGFMPAPEAFMLGKGYLEKAIELDSSLPECQLQLSWVSFLEDWDIEGAYRNLANVYEKSPTVDYYQTMASTIVAEGKFGAAWNYIETASQLDPMSEINYHLKGFILYCQEKYEDALVNYRKCQEIRPDSSVSVTELGQTLILLDRAGEALDYFLTLPESVDELTRLGGTTLAYAYLGDSAETTRGINKLEKALETEYNFRAFLLLAYTYVAIGDHQKALDLLEKGIQLRMPLMVYIEIEPLLKPIRSFDRFNKIVVSVLGEIKEVTSRVQEEKKEEPIPQQLMQRKQNLVRVMETKKPYLDAGLTLRQLADMLSLSANQTSQLLNEAFSNNFSDLINDYRLEDFKEKATTADFSKYTIEDLAKSSGFESRAVFDPYFKKKQGITPDEYINVG